MLWIRRCFGQPVEGAWAGKNGERSVRYKAGVDERSNSTILDHATFVSRFYLPAAGDGAPAGNACNGGTCPPRNNSERRIAVACAVQAQAEASGRRPPRGLLVDEGGGLNPKLSLRAMWVALNGTRSGESALPLGSDSESYQRLLEDLSKHDKDFRAALRDVTRASYGRMYCAVKHKLLPGAPRDRLYGVSRVELSTCSLRLEGGRQVPGLLLLVQGGAPAGPPVDSRNPSFADRTPRTPNPSGISFGGGSRGLSGLGHSKVAPLDVPASAGGGADRPSGSATIVGAGAQALVLEQERQQVVQLSQGQQLDAGGVTGRSTSWSPAPRVGPQMPSMTTKMRLAAAARAVAAEVLPASVIVFTYSRGLALGEVAYLNNRAREYLCLDGQGQAGSLSSSRPGPVALQSLPARALLAAIMQYAEPYASRQLHQAAASEQGFCATLKVPAYVDAAGLVVTHGGDGDGALCSDGEEEGEDGGHDGGSADEDGRMTPTLDIMSEDGEGSEAQQSGTVTATFGLTSREPSRAERAVRPRTTMGMSSFVTASRRSSMVMAVAGAQVTSRAMSMRAPPGPGAQQRARTGGTGRRTAEFSQEYLGPELQMLSRAVLAVHADVLRPNSAGLNRPPGSRGGRGGSDASFAAGRGAGGSADVAPSSGNGGGGGYGVVSQVSGTMLSPRTSRRRLQPALGQAALVRGSSMGFSSGVASRALDASEQELLQRLGESGSILSSTVAVSRPPSKPNVPRHIPPPLALLMGLGSNDPGSAWQAPTAGSATSTAACVSSTALTAGGGAGGVRRPLTGPNQVGERHGSDVRGLGSATSGGEVAPVRSAEGQPQPQVTLRGGRGKRPARRVATMATGHMLRVMQMAAMKQGAPAAATRVAGQDGVAAGGESTAGKEGGGGGAAAAAAVTAAATTPFGSSGARPMLTVPEEAEDVRKAGGLGPLSSDDSVEVTAMLQAQGEGEDEANTADSGSCEGAAEVAPITACSSSVNFPLATTAAAQAQAVQSLQATRTSPVGVGGRGDAAASGAATVSVLTAPLSSSPDVVKRPELRPGLPGARENGTALSLASETVASLCSPFAASTAAAAPKVSALPPPPPRKAAVQASSDFSTLGAPGRCWLDSPARSGSGASSGAAAPMPQLDMLLRACRTVDSPAPPPPPPRSRLGGSGTGMAPPPPPRGSVQGAARAPLSGSQASVCGSRSNPPDVPPDLDGRRDRKGESDVRPHGVRNGEGGSGSAVTQCNGSVLELEPAMRNRSFFTRVASSNGRGGGGGVGGGGTGGAASSLERGPGPSGEGSAFANGGSGGGGPHAGSGSSGGTQAGSLGSPGLHRGSGSGSPSPPPLHRLLLLQQRVSSKSRMSLELARETASTAAAAATAAISVAAATAATADAAVADGCETCSSGTTSAATSIPTSAANRRSSLAAPAAHPRAAAPGLISGPVEVVTAAAAAAAAGTSASGANGVSAGLWASTANSTSINLGAFNSAGLGSGGGGGVGPATLQGPLRDNELRGWEGVAASSQAPSSAISERLTLEGTRPVGPRGHPSVSGCWAATANGPASAVPGGRSGFGASAAVPIRGSRRLNSLRARVHALLDQAVQVEMQRAGSTNVGWGTTSQSLNLASMRPASSVGPRGYEHRPPSDGVWTAAPIMAAPISSGGPRPPSPLLRGGSGAGTTIGGGAGGGFASSRLDSAASTRRSSMQVVRYEDLLAANASAGAIGAGGGYLHGRVGQHPRQLNLQQQQRPAAPVSADGCRGYVDPNLPFARTTSVQGSAMLQILGSMDEPHGAAAKTGGCSTGVSDGVSGGGGGGADARGAGTDIFLHLGNSGGGVAELTCSGGLVSGRAPVVATTGGAGGANTADGIAGSDGITSGGGSQGQPLLVPQPDRGINICYLTPEQLRAAAEVRVYGQGALTAPNASPVTATVTAPLEPTSMDKTFMYGNATARDGGVCGPSGGNGGGAAVADGSTGVLQAELMDRVASTSPFFIEGQRRVSIPRADASGFAGAAKPANCGVPDLQAAPLSGEDAAGPAAADGGDHGGIGVGRVNGPWSAAARAGDAGCSTYGMGAVPSAVAWCQLRARTCTTVDGRRLLMLILSDITKQMQDQARVASLVEQEHRILEALFPRHVIAYLTAPNTGVENETDAPATPAAPAPRRRGLSPRGGELPRRTIGMPSLGHARFGLDCDVSIGSASAARGQVQLRELAAQQHRNTLKVSQLATEHKMVTILFSDIVGFTAFSRQVPPLTVMRFLNELYQKLDALLDIYKVYKVETIGDCYVVAGGLVRYDEDGLCTVLPEGETDELHAVRVMEFAKAMLRASREVALPTTGEPVQVRLGLHSGPAMSGVVGSKMPRFTVFGETVEAAHRMESSGKPGRIHVSGVTKALLRNESWEQTEGVQIEGRGRIDTYLWQEEEEDDTYKQRVMAVYV